MEKTTVVVIGGGTTGLGILRDLSMRGVKALLVEKNDLVNGASSRYHGLLHSGRRYTVKDQEATRECIIENQIMRKIGRSCVESCGGMFTRLDIDDWLSSWIETFPRARQERVSRVRRGRRRFSHGSATRRLVQTLRR